MRAVLVTSALFLATSALAATGPIFNADFNELSPGLALTQPTSDPLPLKRPTNVVLDFPGAGDTIEIVTEAGDLHDQPVLLDAQPGGISWGAFLTPNVYSTGAFSVSWDSLVMDLPPSDDPGPYTGMLLVTRTGDPSTPSTLQIQERWEMRYTSDATFEFIDLAGVRTAGSFTIGQSDRFDLDFDLDTGAWDLDVNGNSLLSGTMLPPFEFGGTIFMTNGRQQSADPPALVVDNLLVEAIAALTGDYNGNGVVEQADIDLVLLHWGEQTPPAPSGWIADLPNGAIDQEELDGVLLNWGATSANAATPEPSTALLVVLLVCVTTVWHKKFASTLRG